ncbi:MAG TPA: substrate-binding domain-containing protein [Solirubrobacterales bacterium]|nr:substrate-binding domain-containing protein [Solirubrobacterales bacterium]
MNYVSLGSPAALRHWGAEDGSLHVKDLGFLANFIGTDIAPAGPAGEEGTMMAKMKAALGSDLAVVPVTQTSIAIVVHPPVLPAHSACEVSRINSAQLQKVFSGELKNWRQLNAASDPNLGGDCDQAITRIVRDDSAGTTYQLKHYLNSINPAPLACTGEAKRTWAQLQAPFGGEATPNTEWPRKAACQEGEGPVTTVSGPGKEGEFGPLAYVRETPGTITYGSLPEAELQAPKQIIDVHNGVKFASPATSESEANCGAAKYTRPAGWAGGVNLDWSQVYGSDPNIGEVAKNAYPICTLTYDIAATDRFTEKAATTVHDYLAFAVAKEGGQAAVRQLGYHDLPASIVKAADAAIAQINGNEEEGGEEEEGGTVLCRVAPEEVEGVLTCPKGQGFSGTIFGAVMPKTVATFESLSGPEVSITCTDGFFAGQFDEDGTGIFGGISGFHFGAEGEPCKSTFPEEPAVNVGFDNPPYYASRFVYTGPGAPQGSFELRREDEAPPLLHIQRPEFGLLDCIYEPESLDFQVTNGSPTEMVMSGKWNLLEGSPKGECPAVLSASAHLGLTGSEEQPLYIAGKGGEEEGGGEEEEEGGGEEEEGGGGTVLCKAEPALVEGGLTCPKGEGFGGIKVTGSLLPETVASFKSAGEPKLTVTCPQGEYSGEFNEDGTSTGNGISSLEFGSKEGCSTTFPEEPEAVVSFENPPYDASQFQYTGAEAPQGFLDLAKSSKGTPLLRIQSAATCIYTPGDLQFRVFNGSKEKPTQMNTFGKWSLVEESPEGACPTFLTHSAQLTLTGVAEGESLYIAGK